MPEGPEVKKLTDYLRNKILNEELLEMNILGGRYLKHNNLKNYKNFIEEIPSKIININCKGKFIYIEFKNEWILFITLGMSGWFRLNKKEKISDKYDMFDKHDNIRFKFKDKDLFFNDYRNFGTLMFMKREDLEKKLKILGSDIFDINFDFNEFRKRYEKKRDDTKIGNLLMDQKVISGVGNYLRADGLYLSKINPHRRIDEINEDELKLLINNLRELAWMEYNEEKGRKLGIIKKLKHYKDFYVYNQKIVNGYKVIREKLKDRTIHWIKEIQK